MSESTDTDPNEKRDDERAAGRDHAPISEADAFGTKLNPVRETPTPFGGLSEGGTKTG